MKLRLKQTLQTSHVPAVPSCDELWPLTNVVAFVKWMSNADDNLQNMKDGGCALKMMLKCCLSKTPACCSLFRRFFLDVCQRIIKRLMSSEYAGSMPFRPPVASRPVAAVGAVRRSWFPQDAIPPSGASIGDTNTMLMSGSVPSLCRPMTMGSYANQSNQPMMTDGDGLLTSGTGSFLSPVNLDPVMAGFVSANPNPMMPVADGQ
jgi:hypothetical protein